MSKYEELNTVCTACGKEDLLKAHLGYTTPELVCYCKSPANCVAAHPNSFESTVRRGYQVPLISYTQALEEYKAKHVIGEVSVENIQAYELLNKSVSTRLLGMEDARFIVKVKNEMNLNTSKAIAHIIESFRKHVEGGDDLGMGLSTPEPVNADELKPEPTPTVRRNPVDEF